MRDARLKYPKEYFTQGEVQKEIKKMNYPKAWTIKHTKENIIATFHPTLAYKHYHKR